MRHNSKKKIRTILGSALFIASTCLYVPIASAADAWSVIAGAIGGLAAYKTALSAVLDAGNSPYTQAAWAREDAKTNGLDDNTNDTDLIDAIMHKLTSSADYALRVNSLPFTWQVTNSNIFNAACYPTDYISINRGLVRGFHNDADEIAAVLAHEMTHGLMQHSAEDAAKSAAVQFGAAIAGMNLGGADGYKLSAMAGYSVAKDVTVMNEYAADAGGFYLMTDAGFNPGAPAAAMLRLDHYLTYETQDIREYQDLDPQQKKLDDDMSDHPDTQKRKDKLAAMMTDYSAGHITVKDDKTVCIDGVPWRDASATDSSYDNTAENAYYMAGGLARAFHDYTSAADWNFDRANKTLLTDAPVYRVLRESIRTADDLSDLQARIETAYQNEATNGARQKLEQEEAARHEKNSTAREEAKNADEKSVARMRENADAYSDLGDGTHALFEVARVFDATHMDNKAESLGIRGRAKAVAGDYAGALVDANQAVAMDAQNIYNYLNRADVHRMRGEPVAALQDCKSALAIDGKNPAALLLCGEIEDDLANKTAALESFRAFYKLRPNNAEQIPRDYREAVTGKKVQKTDKA